MKNQIKKNAIEQNLEIEYLAKQLEDWKLFNSQLQETANNKDADIYHKDCLIEGLKMDLQDYNELKNMNLFQLILWKLKQ